MRYYISYQTPSPMDLKHHGVLGMKWGVRRYQNKDGSLTPEGMKRYGVDSTGRQSAAGRKQASKDYMALATQADKEMADKRMELYVRAYNRFVDDANGPGGIIEKYNKTHSPEDPDYESGMQEIMQEEVQKNLARYQIDFLETNDSWRDAQWLADKFGIESYDKAVRENREFIREIKRLLEE